MIPGTKYSPEQMSAAVLKYRWYLAGGLLAGALLAFGVSTAVPKRFKSTAVILVVPQRVPENYIRSTVTARIEDRIKTVSQEILGQTWLQRIIEEFDLYPEIRRSRDGMQEAIGLMRVRDVHLEFVKGDAFSVSYSSVDPKVAQRVAARLASDFVSQNLKDRVDVADATTGLLDSELQVKKKQLEDSEHRLEAYRRLHSGELPTQVDANQRVLQNTQIQVQAILDSMNRDQDRRVVLQRDLADALASESAAVDPVVIARPTGDAFDPMAVQVAQAQGALRDLLTRYKDTHPDVAAARRRLKELEGKYASEQRLAAANRPADAPLVPVSATARVQQSRIRQLRNEIETIDRQVEKKELEETRLRGVMASLQHRIDASPTRETELVQLTRDYTTLNQMYVNLLTRKEDASLAAKVENGQIGQQFKVLDPARVPSAPYFPNVPLIVAFGAMSGLGLVVLIAGFIEYRDGTLKTEDDVVACLGLPVIAVIPIMTRTIAAPGAGRFRRLLPWGGAAAVLLSVAAAARSWLG